MPIYAYSCQRCGATPEYIQKFSDPPMTVCEACGGSLARAVTAAAFHLKGGGWYKDGYASSKPEGGSTDKPEAASPSDGAASKPADTTTTTTPAAAPAAPAAKAAAE